MTPEPVTGPVRVLELRSVWGTGGGPEKTILLGAARADPSHCAVTVSYIRDARDPVFGIDERARTLGVDYVEIRERHSLDPSIWRQLRRVVRDRRIDVVHAHDYKTDLLALLLGRVEAVIPLATAHGWAGHGRKERWLYYPADRRLLTRFPKVIVVSPDMRSALLRHGAAGDRVEVVPNGIDEQVFRRERTKVPAARRALGLDPGGFAVGAVGRLEREKNYPLLLTAFKRLCQEFPQARLFIAGDGQLRPMLESLIEEIGLSRSCTLLGQVTDVSTLHHALDAFVMCSDNEGSPNALLEAMALETPLVATEVGGVQDLVDNGIHGLLVPRRDEDALVRALREVHSKPAEAAERAAAARSRVERDLSFAKRMERVERIYSDLMLRYAGVRLGIRWRTIEQSRSTKNRPQ